jgi:hypothetical protein
VDHIVVDSLSRYSGCTVTELTKVMAWIFLIVASIDAPLLFFAAYLQALPP